MITFNKLYITSDRKHLVVNASIVQGSYYDDLHISGVYIDTQKTFKEDGPSATPLFSKEYGNNDDEETYVTTINEIFDVDSIGDNLFFVWIVTEGDLAEDTPCGMKDKTALGVVYNNYDYYKQGMNYLRQLNNSCTPPRDLIDFFLKRKAFELSLELGDYSQAINYWNSFYNIKNKGIVIKSNCGCNG